MKPPPSDALQNLLGRHWHHLPTSEVGQLLETNLEAGLDLLGFQLDGVSWQALEEEHPALAGAVQEVVKGGYSPQQIRQYVIQRDMPLSWARWLEQAARFLQAGGVTG